MSVPSLTDLIRPREYRKASVQLLWPASLKPLVRQLADGLGTSVNELVLRSLQRSIAELSPNEVPPELQALIPHLLEAFERSPSKAPRSPHGHAGANADEEEAA
jgi:hypothetical protein